MSGKGKLKKFAEITSFPNVLEAFTFENGYLNADAETKVYIKGKWGTDFFDEDRPISLELACGKGEYTVGLARLFPGRNFVGVDIKGNRIWKGARQAIRENLDNAGFLRSRIEFLSTYFAPDEVAEIWIIFPDPFLRLRDSNRRLTSSEFLDRYKEVLKDGALIHLKTDSDELYEYSLESISRHPHFEMVTSSADIDQVERSVELSIRTYYEQQHLAAGKKIKYIRARFRKHPSIK
ncbi:tRNA (guanosine(46)-N7)-methyltransferase TrmB [Membranicola marinus]|uniref:tRNA (guanine-N(7)-)-methyltransferase n=1 Tax=Membranihabitans marinus TaxID=1227546 RepID=A0A953L6M7_9BACT|nr:tRNA (guanosine(46)-N7)-methyltransferase TrmB [Membranihabitans marinus]MBY5957822.1 tRNA (guanosine(46)-N7)-methyltransferase TrmB [Membranihabitans marinus]